MRTRIGQATGSGTNYSKLGAKAHQKNGPFIQCAIASLTARIVPGRESVSKLLFAVVAVGVVWTLHSTLQRQRGDTNKP